MKSHSIWEFPVFWLVDTVVTWSKMRLWEISGLFETFGSDGSLQDTLKVSNRHYLKLFDSLFETFLIWNLCYVNLQLIWCLDFTEVRCVFWRLRHCLKLFGSLFETCCFLFETFLKRHFLLKLSTLKWNILLPSKTLLLNLKLFCWNFTPVMKIFESVKIFYRQLKFLKTLHNITHNGTRQSLL